MRQTRQKSEKYFFWGKVLFKLWREFDAEEIKLIFKK